MDFLRTLLMYMTATFVVAVESTSTPSVTPVPTPAPEPAAIVAAATEMVTEAPTITPAPTVSVTPVPVPTITPNTRAYHNLSTGSKGAEVRRLQERLIELGYLPEGSADGAYGRQTAAAVRRFQYYNGLTQDGIAGRATQTNLFENPDAAPYPQKTATPEPVTTPEPAPESEPAETAELASESEPAEAAEPVPDSDTDETAKADAVSARDEAETETAVQSDSAEAKDVPEIALMTSDGEVADAEPVEDAEDAGAEVEDAAEGVESAEKENVEDGQTAENESTEAADAVTPNSEAEDGAEAEESAEKENVEDGQTVEIESAEAADAVTPNSEAEDGAEAEESAEKENVEDGQTAENKSAEAADTAEAQKEDTVKEETPEPTDDSADATLEESASAEEESGELENGVVENVDLDEMENPHESMPEPEESPYVDLAGWIVLNDSGEAMQWTELADGVPVVRSARLQRREEDQDIRLSLDDVVKSVDGWVLTDEGDSLVLEAQGYTLALLNEQDGFVAMVDGTEMDAAAEDFSFEEGHYIRADFLTRALDGEWVWDAEEETLMLRIPVKNSYQD